MRIQNPFLGLAWVMNASNAVLNSNLANRSELNRLRWEMQSLRIILTCIVPAVLYGIVHDQVTARICARIFLGYPSTHFPHAITDPPCARLGRNRYLVDGRIWAFSLLLRLGQVRARVAGSELVLPIAKLLCNEGVLAAVAGLVGYLLGSRGTIAPPEWIAVHIAPERGEDMRALWLTGGRTMLHTAWASSEGSRSAVS